MNELKPGLRGRPLKYHVRTLHLHVRMIKKATKNRPLNLTTLGIDIERYDHSNMEILTLKTMLKNMPFNMSRTLKHKLHINTRPY